MALFPQSGSQYFDTKDIDIQNRMENFYNESITINQAFWGEADIDTRFEAGDQQIFADIYGNVPFSKKKSFNFNHIRRVVNMISGHQRRNRASTVVVPVENADEQTADQFTKLLFWCNQRENVLNTISDSFQGALVTGMNFLQVWVDYRNDPISGDIKVDNCSYNSFLVDPFFRKKDLSDCNGLWKRSYLSQKEAMSLLPDHKEEISQLTGINTKDGKFQFLPENYDMSRSNLLTYDEFYYKDYRKQKMLLDTQTGESMEWRGKEDESLAEFLRFYPQVTVLDQDVPTVKMAIVVQGKVFYDGQNPLGTDRYPFVPVFGYYNPQMPDYSMRIQGVVRGLRDPQYLYNRRKILELGLAESTLNSGYIAKEDALVDPSDVFKTGEGGSIFLKTTAQMTDITPIQSREIPQSWFQASDGLKQEMPDISGVNEELLGSATDDKAGILAKLRQGAGLTTLQVLFDQLDMSQKLLGQLMIDVIQSNFAPGKIKRIIEDEPTQQFYNKAFGKYDAAVEEGLNTTTQRQMQFAQLLQLREMEIPIPDDFLVKAATVQDKKEITDAINKSNEEKSKQEQMQLETAMREAEARIKLAEARATADTSLGIERVSRVEENEAFAVERMAEAEKDRSQAVLNMAKTAQEIDDIDIGQVQKILTLLAMLKEGSEAQNTVKEQTSTPVTLGNRVKSPQKPVSGLSALR